MEVHQNWLWYRSKTLLPTTVQTDSTTTNTKPTSISTPWFQSVSLKRLWNGEIDDAQHTNTLPTTTVNPFRTTDAKRSELTCFSLPSYLNSGARGVSHYSGRRKSSLFDGAEQVLHLMQSDQHKNRLVLPKSQPKGVAGSPRHVRKPAGDMSHIPVPIPPVKKFHLTGRLYGYLDRNKMSKGRKARKSTAGPIFAITIIFLGGLFALYSVYRNFPALDEDEKCHLKLPRDIEDAKRLGLVLQKYKSTNFYEVTTLFFLTYIFLQTFAIPGSVFLSILSGYLYPLWFALSVVCLCSAVGATGCYMISYFVGKPLVLKYLPNRTQSWQVMVERQRDNLFNYLLFLRITPFLPNWFINIVSPVLKIPVYTFFFATFFGVAPLSFIAIQAGTTLYQLSKAGDAFSWNGILVMGVLAGLSLLPVVLKGRLKNKFE